MRNIRVLQSSYYCFEQSCDLFEQDQFSCAYMSKQNSWNSIGMPGE